MLQPVYKFFIFSMLQRHLDLGLPPIGHLEYFWLVDETAHRQGGTLTKRPGTPFLAYLSFYGHQYLAVTTVLGQNGATTISIMALSITALCITIKTASPRTSLCRVKFVQSAEVRRIMLTVILLSVVRLKVAAPAAAAKILFNSSSKTNTIKLFSLSLMPRQ